MTRRKVETVSTIQVWIEREKALLGRFVSKLEANMRDLLLNAGFRAHTAAISIQKSYRGHRVRLELKAVLVELRKMKAELREQSILLIQCFFRRQFAREELKFRLEMAQRATTLAAIRKRLAILTIRKLLYPKLIAVKRAEKELILKRRKRRILRLHLLLQRQQRTSKRLIGSPTETDTGSPISRSSKGELRPKESIIVPQVEAEAGAVEIRAKTAIKVETCESEFEDFSSKGEEIVPMQPLGRLRIQHGYSRPTASSVERSLPFPSLTLPTDLLPSPLNLPRSPHYLSGTHSSRLRSDPNYHIPVIQHKPLRSLSPNLGRYLQPTEAWNRYSTMRKALFRRVNRGESRGRTNYSMSPRHGEETMRRDRATPKTAEPRHRGQTWTNRALAGLLPSPLLNL